MSRINDALKRAKEAQQSSPAPAPAPQLRPAQPTQPPARGIGLMVPVVFVVVALLGVFLLWQIRQKGTAENQPPEQTVLAAAAPAPAATQPAVPAIAAAPQPTISPPPAPGSMVALVQTPHAASVLASANPSPSLRLQAVFFTPHSVSAMISGQTVTTGDEVAQYHVAAITPNSVTLVSSGQTNVLKLKR